tara:strand:+ start:17 stop:655 length:639 start_codon:yes stop_codon:yes gene_type:complete
MAKIFGIDTDRIYEEGFDSMQKYRERNPNNPMEVLQTAGGKLSNIRHGVSTSRLRDGILKLIDPKSFTMRQAPPSKNFEELIMSERGVDPVKKAIANVLAYAGAATNEFGKDFFTKETLEDLTANLFGLMKTDVYDSPEDKAEAINSLLDTDKGAVNKYLQSLAPEDKYRQDLSLMHGMHFNRMRDQDLNMMKQKANKKRERIDFGLGEFSG